MAVLAASLGACGSGPREEPIRIGMNVWPGYEYLYLAQEKRIFEDAGVDVQIVEFTSTGDARRALAHGQIDGLASTFVELLALRDELGLDVRAVLTLDYSNGGDVLMADDSVASVADLDGKVIAIEQYAPGTLLLARALADAGLDPADVTLRSADQLELPGLARRGVISAAVTYAPVSTRLADAGFHPLFSSARMPGQIVDVLSFGTSEIEERHDDIARVVRAWDAALDAAAEHPGDAYRTMAAREEVSPRAFADSLQLIRIPRLDEQQRLFGGGILQTVCEETAEALVVAGDLADARAADGCVDGGPLEQSLGTPA